MNYTKFVASEKQKKIQKTELQISKVLLDVCNQKGLKIWACYGTLLGAVRHSGFIPWDDDMDFVMMREDYDKLYDLIVSKSPELVLPDEYEFDITNIRAIKLRDKNTTMKPKRWRFSKDISYGVWVDIISLDMAPDKVMAYIQEYEKLKRKIQLYLNGELCYYAYDNSIEYWLKHFLCRLCLKLHNSFLFRKKIENQLRFNSNRFSGKNVWGYMIWSTLVDIKKIKIYPKNWFDDTVYLPFEDMMLPCPKEYEKILTAQYGDWRTPVMGASQHEGTYVDVNKPYADYIDDFIKMKPWWKRYSYQH